MNIPETISLRPCSLKDRSIRIEPKVILIQRGKDFLKINNQLPTGHIRVLIGNESVPCIVIVYGIMRLRYMNRSSHSCPIWKSDHHRIRHIDHIVRNGIRYDQIFDSLPTSNIHIQAVYPWISWPGYFFMIIEFYVFFQFYNRRSNISGHTFRAGVN